MNDTEVDETDDIFIVPRVKNVFNDGEEDDEEENFV